MYSAFCPASRGKTGLVDSPCEPWHTEQRCATNCSTRLLPAFSPAFSAAPTLAANTNEATSNTLPDQLNVILLSLKRSRSGSPPAARDEMPPVRRGRYCQNHLHRDYWQKTRQ